MLKNKKNGNRGKLAASSSDKEIGNEYQDEQLKQD